MEIPGFLKHEILFGILVIHVKSDNILARMAENKLFPAGLVAIPNDQKYGQIKHVPYALAVDSISVMKNQQGGYSRFHWETERVV